MTTWEELLHAEIGRLRAAKLATAKRYYVKGGDRERARQCVEILHYALRQLAELTPG